MNWYMCSEIRKDLRGGDYYARWVPVGIVEYVSLADRHAPMMLLNGINLPVLPAASGTRHRKEYDRVPPL
jgi:hypothetical protein